MSLILFLAAFILVPHSRAEGRFPNCPSNTEMNSLDEKISKTLVSMEIARTDLIAFKNACSELAVEEEFFDEKMRDFSAKGTSARQSQGTARSAYTDSLARLRSLKGAISKLGGSKCAREMGLAEVSMKAQSQKNDALDKQVAACHEKGKDQ